MNRSFLVAAFTLATAITAPASAETLRVVSWNVANLAQGPGHDLRGYERTQEDYDHLKLLIAKMAPDVIALQELGSVPAAESILGANYEIHFETRCTDNRTQCREDVEDIHNAIAYRKDLPGVLDVFQIDSVAVFHESDCVDEPRRRVRGAVGVKVEFAGTAYWIPSLHIKANCKTNDNETSADQRAACATQRAQFQVLVDWMKGLPEDDAVILAGDFNRQLLTPSDNVRNRILLSFDPDLIFAPSGPRQCWSDFDVRREEIEDEAAEKFPEIGAVDGHPLIFRPTNNRLIDFFLIRNLPENAEFVAVQVPLKSLPRRFEEPSAYLRNCDGSPKAFETGRVLTFAQAFPSDHCPILMEVIEQ